MKALSIAVAISTFNPIPQSHPRLFTFQNPFRSSLYFPTLIKSKTFSLQKLSAKLGFNATMVAQASPPPPSVKVKDQIELTETEKKIFERLLKVVEHFDLKTELRVAGGWVRDKLLGKECYDIDIALDNKLGREFCEKVNEYSTKLLGEEAQGVGVIECNPDQSKHLETARMRIFDVWIDFVNLRAEDYSENSRIPTMVFGSAEDDALRRDLTINSLFYNINTSSVEDFTKRGIADLKGGKIVTPLPPKKTFLDDPLRVLRAIRFGARFEFMLDEELKKAAEDEDVRAAIAGKISRERIGHEIDLMISGNQPVQAMTYIADLKLFWTIFSLPSTFEPSIPEGCDRLCVAYLNSAWGLLDLIGCSSFSDDQRRLCLFAALFLPLRGTIYRDKKAKEIPVVDHIFRNSLKLKASDAVTVISLHNAAKKFVTLAPFLVSKEEIAAIEVDWKRDIIEVPNALKLRVLAGLLLKEIKEFWRVALLLSIELHPVDIVSSTENIELDNRTELFKIVENAVRTLGLERVWNMKPLLDGNEIINILQIKKGPSVGEWQQKVLQWQLAYPSGTVEECLDWMKQSHSKRARTE